MTRARHLPKIPIAPRADRAEQGLGAGQHQAPRNRGPRGLSARHEESIMSNSQSDRSRVAASDPSEVRYFANKHGITEDQVQSLIKEHGNNRKTLEEAVARSKAV
jgi:hypothetical protein